MAEGVITITVPLGSRPWEIPIFRGPPRNEFQFNVLLFGLQDVGKTHLLRCFHQPGMFYEFVQAVEPSINFDFRMHVELEKTLPEVNFKSGETNESTREAEEYILTLTSRRANNGKEQFVATMKIGDTAGRYNVKLMDNNTDSRTDHAPDAQKTKEETKRLIREANLVLYLYNPYSILVDPKLEGQEVALYEHFKGAYQEIKDENDQRDKLARLILPPTLVLIPWFDKRNLRIERGFKRLEVLLEEVESHYQYAEDTFYELVERLGDDKVTELRDIVESIRAESEKLRQAFANPANTQATSGKPVGWDERLKLVIDDFLALKILDSRNSSSPALYTEVEALCTKWRFARHAAAAKLAELNDFTSYNENAKTMTPPELTRWLRDKYPAIYNRNNLFPPLLAEEWPDRAYELLEYSSVGASYPPDPDSEAHYWVNRILSHMLVEYLRRWNEFDQWRDLLKRGPDKPDAEGAFWWFLKAQK